MNQIFTVVVRIMNDQYCRKQSFDFLESLNICLVSSVGKEHLFDYLKKESKQEIVMFLKLLSKFKSGITDRQRFIVAQEIVRANIGKNATNKLNILDRTAENVCYIFFQSFNWFIQMYFSFLYFC